MVDAATLRAFNAKVQDKASWSRGLLVSYSGFSLVGLGAFGRGNSVICMDGRDLHAVLSGGLDLGTVLAMKARRAARPSALELGRGHDSCPRARLGAPDHRGQEYRCGLGPPVDFDLRHTGGHDGAPALNRGRTGGASEGRTHRLPPAAPTGVTGQTSDSDADHQADGARFRQALAERRGTRQEPV